MSYHRWLATTARRVVGGVLLSAAVLIFLIAGGAQFFETTSAVSELWGDDAGPGIYLFSPFVFFFAPLLLWISGGPVPMWWPGVYVGTALSIALGVAGLTLLSEDVT